MKAIGLDLGERRIGVAVSDRGGTLASPWTVIERSRERSTDHARVAALVAEVGAQRVVVGLPLSLQGTEGPAAQAAREEALALAQVVGVPVELVDERLTTVTADRALRGSGQRRERSVSRRRQVVDQVAAAVMLQAFLDRRRGTVATGQR